MLNLKQYFFTVWMFLLCWEVIYPKVRAKKTPLPNYEEVPPVRKKTSPVLSLFSSSLPLNVSALPPPLSSHLSKDLTSH